jgi:hypothetical protein
VSAPTLLLTLGRLPKALDFARSFSMAGWRVVVAEPFATHLTGASRHVAASRVTPRPSDGKTAYLDALAAIARAEDARLILPVSEETMHVAHLAGRADVRARVFAPPPDRLLALHDKERFIELAAGHGLPTPATARLGTRAARDLARTRAHVIKPAFSCSGAQVALREAGAPLPEPGEGPWTARAVVQERLFGAHLSTFSILHEGRVQGTSVYRGTIMDGTVSVAFERVEAPAVEDWVARFGAATGHSGFASFDFILGADDVPRAIECNPRMTSGAHFFQTEDLAAALLEPFAAPLRFKPKRRMQQFYPALTAIQTNLRAPDLIGRLKILLGSDEATWDPRDPWPFVSMPMSAFTLIAAAMRERKRFGEIATADIAWFEGERAPA